MLWARFQLRVPEQSPAGTCCVSYTSPLLITATHFPPLNAAIVSAAYTGLLDEIEYNIRIDALVRNAPLSMTASEGRAGQVQRPEETRSLPLLATKESTRPAP